MLFIINVIIFLYFFNLHMVYLEMGGGNDFNTEHFLGVFKETTADEWDQEWTCKHSRLVCITYN